MGIIDLGNYFNQCGNRADLHSLSKKKGKQKLVLAFGSLGKELLFFICFAYLSNLPIVLLELNKIAKKKNKNQYIPEDILKQLKGKIVIVSHQFPHNDVEQRLVLFAGEKFPTLLLDVDFKNMNKLTPLEIH